jgi:hypothetical protein
MEPDELKDLKNKVDEIHTALIGDFNKEGLVNRVATIEKSHKTAMTWMKSIVVAMIGVIGKQIHG